MASKNKKNASETVVYAFNWRVYKLLNPQIGISSDDSEDFQKHWEKVGRYKNCIIRVNEKYPKFDWREYRRLNPDLLDSIANNQIDFECHWLEKGVYENRVYSSLTTSTNITTDLNESKKSLFEKKEISTISSLSQNTSSLNKKKTNNEFNWEMYKLLNPDLEEAGLKTEEDYEQHYSRFGKSEGRVFVLDVKKETPDFNWESYKNYNKGLIDLGLKTKFDFELHWFRYGKNEGRKYKLEENYNHPTVSISKINNVQMNQTKSLNSTSLILNNIRMIAIVFPQFHEFEENNKFWGKGFTEWTFLKKMPMRINSEFIKKPHEDIGFYNFQDIQHRKFMRCLADKNNIYGFCFYHYWFNGKKVMEKPLEQMLVDGEPNKPFMLCWANESWTKKWDGGNNEVLIEQTYGNYEEQLEHFDYVLQFFKHPNYIKINNKPIFIYYRIDSKDYDTIVNRMKNWNRMAIQNGFNGVYFMRFLGNFENDLIIDEMNGYVEFNPQYCASLFNKEITLGTGASIFKDEYNENDYLSKNNDVKESIENGLLENGFSHYKNLNIKERLYRTSKFFSYDNEILCEKIISCPRKYSVQHRGLHIGWNNAPRRLFGNNNYATYPHIFKYSNVQTFQNTLKKLYQKIIHDPNNITDFNFIFLNAWNEWNEQCTLEPNDIDAYDYIESIGNVYNYFYDKKGSILHIVQNSQDISLNISTYIENIKKVYCNFNHIISMYNESFTNINTNIKYIHIHCYLDLKQIIKLSKETKEKKIKIYLSIHTLQYLYQDKNEFIDTTITYKEISRDILIALSNSFSNIDYILFPNQSFLDFYKKKINLQHKMVTVSPLDIYKIHDCIWIPNIDSQIQLLIGDSFLSEKDILLLNLLILKYSIFKNYAIQYTYIGNNKTIQNAKHIDIDLYSTISSLHKNRYHGVIFMSSFIFNNQYRLNRCINSGIPILYRNIGTFKTELGLYEKYIDFQEDTLEFKFLDFLNYIIFNQNTYQFRSTSENIQPNRWFIENYAN